MPNSSLRLPRVLSVSRSTHYSRRGRRPCRWQKIPRRRSLSYLSPSIDPVATGIIASLARPGGNVTGLGVISSELIGKRLELLREARLRLSRAAIVFQATNPSNAQYLKQTEIAAQSLGIQLQLLAVRKESDFEHIFDDAHGAGGLIQFDDVLFTSHRRRLVELARAAAEC